MASLSEVDLGGVPDQFLRLLLFFAIVLLGYSVGRLTRALFQATQTARPTSGRILFGKMLVFLATVIAVWVAVSHVYGVDPLNAFTALGLVSLALGFGLQNTVANLAAGVGLTADKPFEVGDRIKVGQTWGDVVGIGLRSTRIRTTAGETVVVPNSLLDTQEVWNYTHERNRDIRVTFPFSISYGSSIPLAESLALQVARSTDGVLAYPEPVALVREFGEDGIHLELRLWIDRAQERVRVMDRVLRRIKRAFDEEGVHFPFPQRTVSYLNEMSAPTPTPDFLLMEHRQKPVALVLVRHISSAPEEAARLMEFVDRIGARALVLHVRPPQMVMRPEAAQKVLNEFMEAAESRNVPAQGRMEVGDPAEVLAQTARRTDSHIVVLPRRHRSRITAGWDRDEMRFTAAVAPVPVVHVDPHQDVSEDMVLRWRRRFKPPHEEEEEKREEEGA